MKTVWEKNVEVIGYGGYDEEEDDIVDEHKISFPTFLNEAYGSSKHDRYFYDEDRLDELEMALMKRQGKR